MKKLGIFMAEGCEMIEGLAVVDVVRRTGEMEIITIALGETKEVTSSHNVTFLADVLISDVNFEELDGIVLPGGMPGTLNLGANETVNAVVKKFAEEGKLVAAICAAPSVLGAAGILEGRHATCHPGFEEKLIGATCLEDAVVIDGHIVTSRGMGTAVDFGLAIVWLMLDDEAVEKVKKSIVYDIQWEVVSENEEV
ncbi:MAG: DJ-1/PfpI family protein [Roseburia sp.]|nr:DJ-1/PfpI family protein [Roseburia sp.]